jgi:Protein of unknown function (DUF4238)
VLHVPLERIERDAESTSNPNESARELGGWALLLFGGAMQYPNVKNAHIVPRTYLANWAVAGKIGVYQVRERKRLPPQLLENVGTRRRFYQRTRPDGTEINDVEWSLGQGEDKATPLLRSFADSWPLPLKHKAQLAELFAYQLLRGPRWKDEYEESTRSFLDEYRERDAERDLTPEELKAENAAFLSDSHRFVRMHTAAITLASVLGSTHWTLLEFPRPVVATSDHPVVAWPGAESRAPEATALLAAGVLECLEFRLPMSPTHAVLMTWADWPDDERVRARGTRDHAANLNAFSVASADRQWFYLPETSPPVGSGKFLPLSLELVPGYSPEAAARSLRRQRASEIVHAKVGRRELADRDFEIVTVSR